VRHQRPSPPPPTYAHTHTHATRALLCSRPPPILHTHMAHGTVNASLQRQAALCLYVACRGRRRKADKRNADAQVRSLSEDDPCRRANRLSSHRDLHLR